MTRYQKGDFTVVPNKEALRGKDPYLQTLFTWICSYADADGICFPSIQRLAKDTGMSKRTVSNKLNELESLGLLDRRNRENTSNEYQVLLVEGGIAPDAIGYSTRCTGGIAPDANELYPVLTKSNELNSSPALQAEREEEKRLNNQIAEGINLFKVVNDSYYLHFKRKVQRDAMRRLIARYGFEKVEQAVAVLPHTNKMPYLPRITTPAQLEERWTDLKSGLEREQAKRNLEKEGGFKII